MGNVQVKLIAVFLEVVEDVVLGAMVVGYNWCCMGIALTIHIVGRYCSACVCVMRIWMMTANKSRTVAQTRKWSSGFGGCILGVDDGMCNSCHT